MKPTVTALCSFRTALCDTFLWQVVPSQQEKRVSLRVRVTWPNEMAWMAFLFLFPFFFLWGDRPPFLPHLTVWNTVTCMQEMLAQHLSKATILDYGRDGTYAPIHALHRKASRDLTQVSYLAYALVGRPRQIYSSNL
ncbi:uncharacterized protein BDW43DRAFT_275061 [Aspergillus alliaceus]|uniref:uncharacterized protein n=1 Tax=Petromyces alliaceus TaxID=209559 RepID=UPI0012A5DCAF|nr:uncharacterized protein BDW43DRAFT_275061 [Aspergillus alliaceus]KAB8233773.1 hypothetical protein BDW43DRAFT_275061 [Aspergillus alliaceus]